MSQDTTQDTTGMALNTRGFNVPVHPPEHLQFWLHSIPTMEVGPVRPETIVFCQSCINHETTCDAVPEDVRNEFLVKVLELRLNRLSLLATPWLVVFIAGICSNPAEAVMWAFFMKMQSIAKKSNVIGIIDLMELFPKGLPTPAGLEWMWNLQKLHDIKSVQDNLLDIVTMKKTTDET